MGRWAVAAVLGALLQGAPANDFVLYWPLDETAVGTAADVEGNNPGTHAGGPTPSTDRPTLLFTNDRSLSFDGVNDAVSRSALGGLSAGNTPHTIAAWIKVVALPANRAWIALLGNAGAGSHHWLINSAGATQFGVWSGAQKQPTLPAGEWHHVAVTFDGTNLAAYLDGGPLGSPVAATFNLQGVPFTLAQAHNGENFFNGILDDVRIYDRALTQAEVQYLSDGNGPAAAPLNLQATAEIRSIRLDWDVVSGATSYTLYWSTTAADPNPAVLASGLTANTFTHSDIDPPTRFYYRVKAFHPVGGTSAFSGEVSEVPLPVPPRTNDHDEGLWDDRCSCGTIPGTGSSASAALGLLLGAALLLRGGRRTRERA